MDCVECEKCQLHGKMQILGLGSAFSVLFKGDENDLFGSSTKYFKNFKRNQFIALVNTLGKLSHSIRYVELMSQENRQERMLYWVE